MASIPKIHDAGAACVRDLPAPRAADGECEVVAMAVHDLKTPLAALRQAIQVMKGGRAGALTEVQARFLSVALANADVLGSLIDRLQGTLGTATPGGDLRPQRLDVAEAARLVVRAMQPAAESRGLSLELRCAPDVPHAWADPVLVRRVLMNLVSNAMKYAAGGGVATVFVERDGAAPGTLALRVRDRGPGLPPGEEERAFRSGERLASTCGREEGSGLGLAIVRQVAESHGGHASVRNNPDAGCTFSVVLPAFGTDAGAALAIRSAASRRSGALRLVALRGYTGAAAAMLADALAPRLPAAWTLVDLGTPWLGIALPSQDGAAWPEVRSLLGDAAVLVESVGEARTGAHLDELELISRARACSAEPVRVPFAGAAPAR